ncbi:hypothetical protein [Kitasatospora viridis]|uniref:Uncharacterized protein n=1 Tax=Kitasatospora viridis TaxID=281105 RepID=A0A561UKP3_9ACTN|nr:hypothetical protein [Kitasatospora viridis]TWF99932.1 hypothetical protein FHX73_113792 [Kitasatospora viridis]
MPRPELGPIAVGDPVIVTINNLQGAVDLVSATITKINPVWLVITQTSPSGRRAREWRMRRDSQRERDGLDPYEDQFATPAQHNWDRRLAFATTHLAAQGIELQATSPWNDPDRRILLADLIRQHTTTEA